MTETKLMPVSAIVNELFSKSPDGLRELVRYRAGEAGSRDDRDGRRRPLNFRTGGQGPEGESFGPALFLQRAANILPELSHNLAF